MDNKGFTLVEMLAVVVILAVVMGIAVYGVTGTINTSRKSSEKIFIDKLGTVIEEYIGFNGLNLVKISNEYEFDKCKNKDCSSFYKVNGYEVASITMDDLITEGLIEKEDVINPLNKKKCLDGVDPVIRIFKDSDYVYYYYVDLSGSNTSCEISNDNSIINTLPDRLYVVLKDNGVIVE